MFSASITPTNSPAAASFEDEFFDDDVPRERVLVVDAGGQCLAIPVTAVREVRRGARCTRVPGAPPVMHGIVNVRGSIVTVLDLGVALSATVPDDRTIGREPPTETDGPRAAGDGSIVLLEHGTQLIGLRVDQVRAVPSRDDAPIAPHAAAPQLLHQDCAHAAIEGIVRAEGDDFPLLDVSALFQRHLLSTKEWRS